MHCVCVWERERERARLAGKVVQWSREDYVFKCQYSTMSFSKLVQVVGFDVWHLILLFLLYRFCFCQSSKIKANVICSYLIAVSALQSIWSLMAAAIDIYALLVKRCLHNSCLVSIFVMGDGVKETFMVLFVIYLFLFRQCIHILCL